MTQKKRKKKGAEPLPPAKPVVGFDLGGTKMYAAVVGPDFKIVCGRRRKTRADKDAEDIFSRMVRTIEDALAGAGLTPADIAGIGVGSPGPLDPVRGVIKQTPNLPLSGFPMKARLHKYFGCPVAVANDVDMGTYGEYHFGAGRGLQHVVGIFVGTGVGGGLILNGKLYTGATGSGGEIGHMIIDPAGPRSGTGKYGTIESFCSRLSLAKELAVMAARGEAPGIYDQARTDVGLIRSKVIADAIADGDRAVAELVLQSAGYLGVGMANIVNILSPEMIVLGGGVVEALGDFYVHAAERAMREHALDFLVRKVRVQKAELGDDAGVLGSAKLIAEAIAAAAPAAAAPEDETEAEPEAEPQTEAQN